MVIGFLPPTRKIHWGEFIKILRSIPALSEIEKAYVQGVFQDALADGLTKDELQIKIDQLKYNFRDPLDGAEVEKIKDKLTKALQEKTK